MMDENEKRSSPAASGALDVRTVEACANIVRDHAVEVEESAKIAARNEEMYQRLFAQARSLRKVEAAIRSLSPQAGGGAVEPVVERAAKCLADERHKHLEWPTFEEFAKALNVAGLLTPASSPVTGEEVVERAAKCMYDADPTYDGGDPAEKIEWEDDLYIIERREELLRLAHALAAANLLVSAPVASEYVEWVRKRYGELHPGVVAYEQFLGERAAPVPNKAEEG